MSQADKLNEIVSYNQDAWDKQVDAGNEWTKPVSSEDIAAAQEGDWEIILTPAKAVPREWFGDLKGKDVLCLASGGGQQGPILAAAGANITVFDNSPKQLEQDVMVAERDGLELKTVHGDMRDLSAFSDGSFDLIADLWGVAKKHNQTELINSINQKYAVNKTLAEVKRPGLQNANVRLVLQ